MHAASKDISPWRVAFWQLAKLYVDSRQLMQVLLCLFGLSIMKNIDLFAAQ
jgi:hypothetical protein